MWAVKAKSANMYYAAQQYGPPGSVTFSSSPGTDVYKPMTWIDKGEAAKVASSLSDSPDLIFRDKWEVVELST